VGSAGTSLYPFGDDYEVTNGQVTKYVSVEGLGVIAKRVGSGTGAVTYWLHTDRLGSIQAVTDGTAQVVFRRTYRPYGQTLAEGGSPAESRGWIDQRNDPETGLTYLHARYYDPGLGVFLSPDPIGIRGGMNQYAYAVGNPVNFTDRFGLSPSDCIVYTPPGNPGGGYQNPNDLARRCDSAAVTAPYFPPEPIPIPPPPNTGFPPPRPDHPRGPHPGGGGGGGGGGNGGAGDGGTGNGGDCAASGSCDGDGNDGNENSTNRDDRKKKEDEKKPEPRTCATFGQRWTSNWQLTNYGLLTAAGAPFSAARTVVGFGISSSIAATSGNTSPMQAIGYIGRQVASSPLGRTPLTNAAIAAAGAAAHVGPQALAVGTASVGLSLGAFYVGVIAGSAIEAGFHVLVCQ
jgi:RHS repeat-associated protein